MAELSQGLIYVVFILFFLVAIPRDDKSVLGMVGGTIDRSLTLLFGTSDMARCPFLRRGMILTQFSQFSYPLEVYACERQSGSSRPCVVDCSGTGMLSADNITAYESTLVRIPLGMEPSCDVDRFLNFVDPLEGPLKCDSSIASRCERGKTAAAVCGQDSAELTVCLRCEGEPCLCEDEYGQMEPCNLDDFMVQSFFSPQAEKERELFALMGTDMPPWVCYVVFGIFPFVVIYFFVQDILQFTLLRQTTKRAVAIAVALFGIFSGAFVGVTVGVVQFMNFSTGQATLFLLVGIAFLTSFMMIFQTMFNPIARSSMQATQLRKSITTLKELYRGIADVHVCLNPSCKDYNKPHPHNMAVCPRCGRPLSGSRCPNCGEDLSQGQTVCPKCGAQTV